MALLRRLAAVVSLVLLGLVAFSATTVALDLRSLARPSMLLQGGGGFGLPAAGTYQNSNAGAGFSSCCGSDGATSVFLDVTHTESLANPLVGPTTSTDEIDVNFSVNDFLAGLFINGCIVADRSSDFTINQLLSFAQLNTTVLATTKTCNNQPLSGVTPPFAISATWSMSASTRQSTSLASYSCGGYSSNTQTSGSSSQNGSATFSATFLTSPMPPAFGSAFIFSFKQSIHVLGVAPDGCIPLGGKGAGGPGLFQAPGDYTSSSMSASMSVQPDDPTQQQFSVFVTSFTNTAHPVGRPISTQSETDLNLFQFSFFQFIQDCWVIPPSAFTMASDLHTATLNVSIDTTTQACQFATNTGPSVFTINATWSATSPVANLSVTSQGGCHVSGKTQQSAATATAVGSWPGTAASINDTNAFLSTNNSTTHVQPGGC